MTTAVLLLAALVTPAARSTDAKTADAPPAAADWPRFRGPNGSGVSDVTFSRPIADEDFAWKVELPGEGHSSPVVRGDRVYLTSADPETAARSVLCLSAETGKTLWRKVYESEPYKQHADNDYASSTPFVDELGVYVSWTTPDAVTLVALDGDGNERWKQDLGRFTSQWGSGASPVVVGDVVVMTNDQEGPKSTAVGVDRKTGRVRWAVDRKAGNKTASSTPCVYTPPGGGRPVVVLTSKASGMTALDPETGKTVWEVPDVLPARTIGSPVVAGDLIVGTCGDGTAERHLVAVRPPPADGGKAAVAYKFDKNATYVPTPLVKRDLMFLWGDAGTVTCVRADTGETVWSEKVGGAFYGSPVCAGDTLWCMSRKGELVGVAAADHFKLVGRTNLGEATHATPALAGGRMFLRTKSHLICVAPKKAA